MTRRAELLEAVSRLRVLVIGEMMLDRYVEGVARRLAPEAVAPVVDVESEVECAGGAANVAANAASLGARVTLATVAGDDRDGRTARERAEAAGVEVRAVADGKRRTLSKTRVIAGGTLLARVDAGTTTAPSSAVASQLADVVRDQHAAADLVLISDYGYGVVADHVLGALVECQRATPKPVAVDAKDLGRYRELGPALVKPNAAQAIAMLGGPSGGMSRKAYLRGRLEDLRALTGAEVVALTMDAEGALVGMAGAPPIEIPAPAAADRLRTVGAGDTYMTVFALALTAGADAREAAAMAGEGAAAVVRGIGTDVCTRGDLAGSERPARLLGIEEAVALREDAQARGARVVIAGGVFDIVHPGHVRFLERARQLGDMLVVAMNGDESVRRLKGPSRPVNTLTDRAAVVAGLGCVDAVVAFEEDTPAALMKQLHPDYFVKGGDYASRSMPEAAVVERMGGSVVVLGYELDRSTTNVIERIVMNGNGKSVTEPA